MSKILIVGGAGYIGGYLTDNLTALRYDVTVLDNLTYEDRFLKKVKFINCDVQNRDALSKIINQYDIVIWLAAIVGDGACAVNPGYTKLINEDSVKWLVDNYKGKIIFTSTCSVYGANNDLIDEDAVPNPLSVYASTKLEAERYITNNYKNYLIFRLGTLYGLGDEHSRIRLDLVVNALTMRASRGETLRVFGGEQWRPLLHVKDVTTAITYGIAHNITGLYNLSEKNFTIKDIAESIKSVIPCNIELNDLKFEDRRNYKVKNDRFYKTGWRPSYSIEYGVKEISDVFAEERIKQPTDPVYSNADFLKLNSNTKT